MAIFIAWSLFLFSASANASAEIAFVIERNTNANLLFYEVDFERRGPIRPYWKMLAQQGQEEPLTDLENARVYGVDILDQTEDMLRFTLKALPGYPITTKLEAAKPVARMKLLGEDRIVRKFFLKLGGFLIPSIRSVEIECDEIGGSKSRIELTPLSSGSWKERLL
ncbi:MAG: DUF4833 domain-containing protein [Bdellovibrionota bacterium]